MKTVEHKMVKTYHSLGHLPLSGLINDHVNTFKEVGKRKVLVLYEKLAR